MGWQNISHLKNFYVIRSPTEEFSFLGKVSFFRTDSTHSFIKGPSPTNKKERLGKNFFMIAAEKRKLKVLSGARRLIIVMILFSMVVQSF
jgi:hypothetical protein